MELTQEQQDLVEKNIKLVYAVAKKLNVSKNEDAIQEGIMGLCVASCRYKKDISKFSTYATNYIRGYILSYLTYDKLMKPHRHNNKYVFENVCFIDNDNDVNIKSETDLIDIQNDIRDALVFLDDEYKLIYQMILEGLTQTQISIAMGCPQATISRRVKELKELIKERVYG